MGVVRAAALAQFGPEGIERQLARICIEPQQQQHIGAGRPYDPRHGRNLRVALGNVAQQQPRPVAGQPGVEHRKADRIGGQGRGGRKGAKRSHDPKDQDGSGSLEILCSAAPRSTMTTGTQAHSATVQMTICR